MPWILHPREPWQLADIIRIKIKGTGHTNRINKQTPNSNLMNSPSSTMLWKESGARRRLGARPRVPLCSFGFGGCTNQSSKKGGVCRRHGAKELNSVQWSLMKRWRMSYLAPRGKAVWTGWGKGLSVQTECCTALKSILLNQSLHLE